MSDSKTIDQLSIEIGASSTQAEQEITKLADALKKLRENVKGGAPNLDKWAEQIKKLSEATKNVNGDSLGKAADALQKLRTVKDVTLPKNLGERLSQLASAVNAFQPASIENLARAADVLERLSALDTNSLRDMSDIRIPDVHISLREQAENTRQLNSVFGGLSKLFRSITAPILTVGKALAGTLYTGLKKAASGALQLTKNLTAGIFNKLTGPVTRLAKKMETLGASFKRIMFYRVVRTVIKEIGEALEQGTKNAYFFSKNVGEATKYISQAYDAFATASFQMKNQIGAAWATLYANIEPFIEKIIALVTKAMVAVTQFIAALGGKSSYLQAKRVAQDWAEETEEGAKAAKEWKNQLMGFDEINRLEDPTESLGKTKDALTDYADMFEEVPVDSGISELAEKMKKLWEGQKWKELGELIGQTINDLFPSEDQFKKWGAKLGDGLNGIIQTAYYALKKMDFHEYGSRIAAGINEALERIDFGIWGRLLVRKLTAALDFLMGMLGGLNWGNIGKALGDALRGMLDEASEWLRSYQWGDVAKNLWENIKAAIAGFDVAAFAKSISDFIITAVNAASDFISGID